MTTNNLYRTVGRPKIFTTVNELDECVSDYFTNCEKSGHPMTISGLALAVGCDRRTLLNYQKNSEFFPTIKRALAICENYAEELLFEGKSVAGIIFNLINNYGWSNQPREVVQENIPYSVKIEFVDASIPNEDKENPNNDNLDN